MPHVIDCIQGSPEWFAARCGRVTASRISDVMTKGKGATRATYAGELVAEVLSGIKAEGFKNAAMAWGSEKEPEARATYGFITAAKLTSIGFCIHPTIEMAGASTDCLVDEDGLLEIKCPLSKNHIAALLGAPIDPDYIKQMQWGLACTERKWCDFVSYDPRLCPEMQIDIRRVHRDPIMIAEMEKEVRSFLVEVDETVRKLKAKFGIKELV